MSGINLVAKAGEDMLSDGTVIYNLLRYEGQNKESKFEHYCNCDYDSPNLWPVYELADCYPAYIKVDDLAFYAHTGERGKGLVTGILDEHKGIWVKSDIPEEALMKLRNIISGHFDVKDFVANRCTIDVDVDAFNAHRTTLDMDVSQGY